VKIMLLMVTLLSASPCVAKDRFYQTATVLGMEERKVGEKEYGVSAHRIVNITAHIYRVQLGSNVYDIQPHGHDPLSPSSIGQTIEVSLEGYKLFLRVQNGKKMKEFEFKIIGVAAAN